MLQHKHLIDIDEYSADEIIEILDTAKSFKEVNDRTIKKLPTLRGRTIINLFLEPSTRTRTSFEIAGKRLSGDVINFSASSSSTTKGETLADTAETLDAMNCDLIVVRSKQEGAPAHPDPAHGRPCGQRRRWQASASHPSAARRLHDSRDAWPHRRSQGRHRG